MNTSALLSLSCPEWGILPLHPPAPAQHEMTIHDTHQRANRAKYEYNVRMGERAVENALALDARAMCDLQRNSGAAAGWLGRLLEPTVLALELRAVPEQISIVIVSERMCV